MCGLPSSPLPRRSSLSLVFVVSPSVGFSALELGPGDFPAGRCLGAEVSLALVSRIRSPPCLSSRAGSGTPILIFQACEPSHQVCCAN